MRLNFKQTKYKNEAGEFNGELIFVNPENLVKKANKFRMSQCAILLIGQDKHYFKTRKL